MLSDKGQVGCEDKFIHEVNEFTHDGDEADLGWFTVGAEASIKRCQDGIGASGTDSGHVEDVTHLCSTAAHVAGTAPGAGVVRVRGHADQGGELTRFDLSQLGYVREDRGGEDRAHAFDLLESVGLFFRSGF